MLDICVLIKAGPIVIASKSVSDYHGIECLFLGNRLRSLNGRHWRVAAAPLAWLQDKISNQLIACYW
jgi:hypothetical protein